MKHLKKLLFIAFLLPFFAQSQTTYLLNYDSIRVGRTAGTGATGLYGSVYLKNTTTGLSTDSILVWRHGKVFRVPNTAPSVALSATSPIFYDSGTGVISSQAAGAAQAGYVTTGTQTISGQKTMTGGLKAQALPAPGVVTKAEGGAGVLPAGTYSIGVTAVSAEGGESAFDYAGYYYNSDPLVIGANRTIDVSWEAVPGAVAYRVYIGDNAQSYYLRYFETAATSININTVPVGFTTAATATPQTTGGVLRAGNYYFAIGGVFSDGETVGQTSYALFPVANITTNTGSVDLSWTAITGVTGYKVYVVSETDGSFRMATKYFTTPTNSITVTGNETYVTGLGAFSSKGNIEFESTAPVVGSSFVQTGNNKSFFSADIAINGFKGANADVILKRYDNAITPFGIYSFAGMSLGTGTSTYWQTGIGGTTNDFVSYNNALAKTATNISVSDNSFSIYGTIKNINTPVGTITTDSLFVKTATTGLTARIAPPTSANTASTIVLRDGSGNFSAGTITATLSGAAPAGSLSGSTLAAGVTASSLTSVGTLTSLTSSGTLTINKTGGANPNSEDQIRINTTGTNTWSGIHLTDNATADGFVSFLAGGSAAARRLGFSTSGSALQLYIDGNGDSFVTEDLLVTGTLGIGGVANSVTSGTYTPTLTNTTNISSSTAAITHYSRIGNEVSVEGILNLTPTTSGLDSEIKISLPIASNFTTTTDLSGMAIQKVASGTNNASISYSMIGVADATNDVASFTFQATGGTIAAKDFTFSFTYTIK